MACCCKSCQSNKSSTICLGRCDLAKHRCLDKEEVKPGPVPRHMGWLYTARDSPEHQLRCGWRPGHISCPVLRRIEEINSMKGSVCYNIPGPCKLPPCAKAPRKCVSVCPSTTSSCKQPVSCVRPACGVQSPCGVQPLIRIIRHAGQYTISTTPSNMNTTPSGPNPLKYVLDTDDDDDGHSKPTDNQDQRTKTRYSIEAKYNDYHFDYISSETSFVLDFTPPPRHKVQ